MKRIIVRMEVDIPDAVTPGEFFSAVQKFIERGMDYQAVEGIPTVISGSATFPPKKKGGDKS